MDDEKYDREITNMRNYVDHSKYYVNYDKSLIGLYNEFYAKFFSYSDKLRKSVLFNFQTILDKYFVKYNVNYCYLFGSYAKGKATPSSDVDLLISADIKGMRFYGLIEEIRTSLHKKVDVLDINQLKDNIELVNEILKDGVKIYG